MRFYCAGNQVEGYGNNLEIRYLHIREGLMTFFKNMFKVCANLNCYVGCMCLNSQSGAFHIRIPKGG